MDVFLFDVWALVYSSVQIFFNIDYFFALAIVLPCALSPIYILTYICQNLSRKRR